MLLMLACRRPGRTSAGQCRSCRRCTTRASCCSHEHWSCSSVTGLLRCSALRTARWDAPPHRQCGSALSIALGQSVHQASAHLLWEIAWQSLLLECHPCYLPWRMLTCIYTLLVRHAVHWPPSKHSSHNIDSALFHFRRHVPR